MDHSPQFDFTWVLSHASGFLGEGCSRVHRDLVGYFHFQQGCWNAAELCSEACMETDGFRSSWGDGHWLFPVALSGGMTLQVVNVGWIFTSTSLCISLPFDFVLFMPWWRMAEIVFESLAYSKNYLTWLVTWEHFVDCLRWEVLGIGSHLYHQVPFYTHIKPLDRIFAGSNVSASWSHNPFKNAVGRPFQTNSLLEGTFSCCFINKETRIVSGCWRQINAKKIRIYWEEWYCQKNFHH